jgi:hypothetical protein
MDKMDKKVMKHLLKPLVQRPQRTIDRNALLDALGKLEERALGEQRLKELQSFFKSLTRKSNTENLWEDPIKVKKAVEMVQSLYFSRRISKQEYVFHVITPIEIIHDHRVMNDVYDTELRPINQKIKEIEIQHGLAPDEYWPLGKGPKEHTKLIKIYDDILESKFIETLREFGLNELADMREKDPVQFKRLLERGRRAIFHQNEQVAVIRDIVVRYEEDARRAASVKAYSSAITAIGAAVEGLLILRCLKSPKKALWTAKKLKRPKLRPQDDPDPASWSFDMLIQVCSKASWMPPFETETLKVDAAGLADFIRKLRNYVHPGKVYRERPWSEVDHRDFNDAEAIYTVLFRTLNKVRKN